MKAFIKLAADSAVFLFCLLAGIYYLSLELTKALFNAVLVGPVKEGNA